jgi:hypothetical protein
MALTGVTDSLPTIPTCVRRSLFPAPESPVIETLESSICGKSPQRWRNSWAFLCRLPKPSRCILPGNVANGRAAYAGLLGLSFPPPATQGFHQQDARVHSAQLNGHIGELRLQSGSFSCRDLKIRDQSCLVPILRLLQGFTGRRHGRRFTDAFLLQLAKGGQIVFDFLISDEDGASIGVPSFLVQ